MAPSPRLTQGDRGRPTSTTFASIFDASTVLPVFVVRCGQRLVRTKGWLYRVWAQRCTLLVTLASAGITGMNREPASARCSAAIDRGQWRDAKEACAEAHTNGHDPTSAVSLARAELQLGNDSEAQRLVQGALEGPLRADALSVLGLSLDRQGDSQGARDAFKEAIALFGQRGAHLELARSWFALAGSHWRERQLVETRCSLDSAAEHAQIVNDRRMLGLIALMRGDVMRAIGDARSAERDYESAALTLAGRPTDLAFVDLKLGILRQEANLLHLSDVSFERVLLQAEAVGIQDAVIAAKQNLAYNAHLQGDTAAGFARLDGWQGPFDFSHYSIRAALEADEGRLRDALGSIDLALSVARSGDVWRGEFERGRILERLGDHVGARQSYERSIALVEQSRRAMDVSELQPWMIPKRRQPYEALLASFVRAEESERALNVLEAFSARSFVDALIANGSVFSTVAQAENIASTWRQLDFATPGGETLSAALADREVIVPVEVLDRLLVAYKPAGGEVRFLDRGSSAPLRALAATFAADPDSSETAATLANALIPDEVRPSAQTLHIVASGWLAEIPYAALRRGGRFLIEERPLAFAPSLRAFSSRYEELPSRGALVVADADGDLPGARAEAAEVAGSLATQALVAGDATRSAIENAESLALLHVATHSGLDGSGAWIRLADGRWSTDDILYSGAHAAVVVLAACSSGSTRHQELWGSLAVAFLANGSDAVISAVGSVDDADTREVMRALYRGNVRQQPVHALASAQRELAARLPAHAWARFFVYSTSGQ
jgi:Flp pilus assembly protein TadD